MRVRNLLLPVGKGLALASLLGGCAQVPCSRCLCQPAVRSAPVASPPVSSASAASAPAPSAPAPSAPALPSVVRGVVQIDLSSVPRPGPRAHQLGRRYRALTAQECQNLANERAGVANLLRTELAALAPAHQQASLSGHKRPHLAQVILACSADDLRNHAAAHALEPYYRLAEAEGRADLVRLSLADIDGLVARAVDAQARGRQPEADLALLRRQQSELRADETQIGIVIDQLNGRLKGLIGLDCSKEDCSVWPSGALRVRFRDVNAEQCVSTAMTSRPDLYLLRSVASSLDRTTLPVVRQMLGSVNALLGALADGGSVSGVVYSALSSCEDREVESARKQVAALLAERERQVGEEVRQPARVLEARFRLVALARQRDEIALQKVADLSTRDRRGEVVGLALSRARLDAHKARAELLHEVVEWHIAQRKFEEAQGLLLKREGPKGR